MKQIISLLLTTLLCVSCYKEIDLNEYRTTPKMVINCAVMPDTVVIASVSRTWFYTENMPDVKLPHAKVELYINGSFTEEMQWKAIPGTEDSEHPDSVFFSTVIPREGDKIKIIASTPQYGTVVAEDEVPVKMPIEEVQYAIRKGEGLYDYTYPDYYEIYYKVTFQELPETGNHYLIAVSRPDYWTNEMIVDLDYIDPVLKEQDAILDGSLSFDGLEQRAGALFTDKSINGQRYTMQLKESIRSFDEGDTRKVAIYSLSEPYYWYLLSLQKKMGSTLEGGLGNMGFAEPLRIYSNVQGGTGILGAFNPSKFDLTLHLK